MNPNATWIRASIIAGSAMFVFALAVSAFFAPQWRALHVMQALPYLAVIILTGRRSAWGYGAGGAIAIGYLLIMVWTVGPPEGIEHIKQAFGLR